MNAVPAARRAVLAALSLAIAAPLFHGQIADALVVRGDEALYRARPPQALQYYRRALWFDPDSAPAVDRFAFVAMSLHDAPSLAAAAVVASRYLVRHRDDVVVRMDRAMAYRALGARREALADFAAVGLATGDARAFAFAGDEAWRLGELQLARTFWRRALILSPGMPIAVHGLARLERVR
jgi:tetratricopeptide (TPR) repeat protein